MGDGLYQLAESRYPRDLLADLARPRPADSDHEQFDAAQDARAVTLDGLVDEFGRAGA